MDGVTISHIATYANMPNPRIKTRLEQMIKAGLVEEILDRNGRKIYKLTPKGIITRNRIREMVIFLKELGLIPDSERSY
jgi:predicted transcriptional regulator